MFHVKHPDAGSWSELIDGTFLAEEPRLVEMLESSVQPLETRLRE